MLRYERINTCSECGECTDGSLCISVRSKLRDYMGVRFTSDGFDCALPVAIDSHSVCSYGCLYCFAENLHSHIQQRERVIGQTRLSFIEGVFSGREGIRYNLFRKALKYDKLKNGYPCPIQLGAICDPLDNIERQQGWFLKFIKIANKYNQPVRISTKGSLFLIKEYLDAISERPELYWVSYSIITPDDDLLLQIDRRAPNATERLKCMKLLSDRGVKVSLRLRPALPGVSDYTPKYPKAYKTLIEKSAEAGACAISYEVGFVPGSPPKDLKRKWMLLEKITKIPFLSLYKSFGDTCACERPPYAWTENFMHAVYEEAKKNNLVVGISDPVWKQLGETGCCCGILPDDPVFGNWQEESATNRLLEAKNNDKEICEEDIIPKWAFDVSLQSIINPGVGPLVRWKQRHLTWADQLRSIWNDIKKQRSPLNYFQGALMPIQRNGKTIYKYIGLKRKHPQRVPYWNV